MATDRVAIIGPSHLVEETKGICLDMHNTVPGFNHDT